MPEIAKKPDYSLQNPQTLKQAPQNSKRTLQNMEIVFMKQNQIMSCVEVDRGHL